MGYFVIRPLLGDKNVIRPLLGDKNVIRPLLGDKNAIRPLLGDKNREAGTNRQLLGFATAFDRNRGGLGLTKLLGAAGTPARHGPDRPDSTGGPGSTQGQTPQGLMNCLLLSLPTQMADMPSHEGIHIRFDPSFRSASAVDDEFRVSTRTPSTMAWSRGRQPTQFEHDKGGSSLDPGNSLSLTRIFMAEMFDWVDFAIRCP
jgi:hypothetical protein